MSLTIREEKILEAAIAGEQSPIEPVTRREAIFTKATGADIELPPARNKEEDILSKLAVGYIGGGGGDETQYETLYDGTITTSDGGNGFAIGLLSSDIVVNTETIKVTFNGVEYALNDIGEEGEHMYGGMTESGPNFSEYPFVIISAEPSGPMPGGTVVYTQNAETYPIKIEVPAEDESADFSIAHVTIKAQSASSLGVVYDIAAIVNGELQAFYPTASSSDKIYDVPLYKGEFVADVGANPVVSGSAEYSNNKLVIKGDCVLEGIVLL